MLVFTGCEIDRCFHGTGKAMHLEISTGYFDELNIDGLLHVILIEDSVNYVEFVGGEKVLDYVGAENIDSALWLTNTNSCFFLRDYEKIKVLVHYQFLQMLNIYNVCKLESYDSLSSLRSMTAQSEMAELNLLLNCEHFSFYNHRTTGGNYVFSGRVDRCWIRGYYIARFEMKNLVARDFYVNNSSLSDMYVNATERLEVQLIGSSNIYYSGSPQIVIDSINGSGQLIPWNPGE
jgi:hypothetical protein